MGKHTEAAKGEDCVRCGTNDGTVVLAHYQGPMAHKLGKGFGIKAHDLAGAWLCRECHDLLDRRTFSRWMTKEDCGLDLAIHCLKTVIIRYERGDL